MEGQPFLRPGTDHDVNRLPEAIAGLINICSDAVELLTLVATADAKVEAAATDDVNRRSLFGGQDGVVERQNIDRRADPHPFGASGNGAHPRVEAGDQPMAREVVLAEPHLVESQLIDQLDLLHRLLEMLGFIGTFVKWNNGKESEFHLAVSFKIPPAPLS